MDQSLEAVAERLTQRLGLEPNKVVLAFGEATVYVAASRLVEAATTLRDDPEFGYEMLIDLAGVDLLEYGVDEWETETATSRGFSRGVDESSFARSSFEDPAPVKALKGRRFAVAYHLLSIGRNTRLRLKVCCEDDAFPSVDSVSSVWACANWYEREAFDLYGIVFHGHPDLRRLLTDYGFIGHPFRKDFPLIGNVEMRYDPEQGRVVYQPVSIEPRVLVPKVIREDHRYLPDPKDPGRA